MAGRPKPRILIRTFDPTNRDVEIQVIPTGKYYIVVYDNQHINVITVNNSQQLWTTVKRYIKTGYPHEGHALRRAHKLNKLFNTDKFTVKELQ